MSDPAKKLELGAHDIERLRGLLEQTTDRRERARLRGLLQYATPEARAAHAELTRRKMVASEALQAQARKRERDRQAFALANAPQLVVLREAWRNASADIRNKFLSEIED
jgi:hypothetical protein